MTETKSIADRMVEAAEMDLALPYSLVQDAWDLLDELDPDISIQPHVFEEHLIAALDAYDANQIGYWTDERIARARG